MKSEASVSSVNVPLFSSARSLEAEPLTISDPPPQAPLYAEVLPFVQMAQHHSRLMCIWECFRF